MNTTKDLAWLFISMAIVFAWCAMQFIALANDFKFPDLLHAAFLAVMAANGYSLYQGVQIGIRNAKNDKLRLQNEQMKLVEQRRVGM